MGAHFARAVAYGLWVHILLELYHMVYGCTFLLELFNGLWVHIFARAVSFSLWTHIFATAVAYGLWAQIFARAVSLRWSMVHIFLELSHMV